MPYLLVSTLRFRSPARLQPGEIAADKAQLIAGCGRNTSLELIEIQLEGKRRMAAREFINGYKPQTGDRLGQ